MNESLDDFNTEVFGESNFDDVSNPFALEELGDIYMEGVLARGSPFSVIPELLQQISVPVENLTFPKKIKTG